VLPHRVSVLGPAYPCGVETDREGKKAACFIHSLNRNDEHTWKLQVKRLAYLLIFQTLKPNDGYRNTPGARIV
jgi:hypothetical protein